MNAATFAGLDTEFRVMVRPASGMAALMEAMAPRVEGPLVVLSSP